MVSKAFVYNVIFLQEDYFSASYAISSSFTCSVTSRDTRGGPQAAAVDGNKSKAAVSNSNGNSTSSCTSNSTRRSTAAVAWSPTASVSATCEKKNGLKESKGGWKAVKRCWKKAAAVAKELLQVCWSPVVSVKE